MLIGLGLGIWPLLPLPTQKRGKHILGLGFPELPSHRHGQIQRDAEERRAKIQGQKWEAHGHPVTRKLEQRTSPVAISGKRQRKLLEKLKREQKEALEAGLITMEDLEMAAVDGTSQVNNQKAQMKFHVKSGSRLGIKKSKSRGKSKRKSTKLPADASAPVDAMVE